MRRRPEACVDASRAPTTRSYSPRLSTRRQASSGLCCPSPSRIRTNSPVARRMPDFTDAPLPLLYGCRTTVAPASAACAAVSSVDPSSTTRISCQAATWRSARTTSATAAPSLNAGMTTDVAAGSAMPRRRPDQGPIGVGRLGIDRRVRTVELQLADAVLHVLEDLAAAGNQVREQADQQHLEADDEQHRGQDQRLQLPVAAARPVVVEEAQRDEQAGGEERTADVGEHL